MSSIIDLAKHIRKKDVEELTPRQLTQKLAETVSQAIDSLTHHVLDLDRRAGGHQAGPALESLAALTDALMMHYVADVKAVLTKHDERYVCIPRKVWDEVAKKESQSETKSEATFNDKE